MKKKTIKLQFKPERFCLDNRYMRYGKQNRGGIEVPGVTRITILPYGIKNRGDFLKIIKHYNLEILKGIPLAHSDEVNFILKLFYTIEHVREWSNPDYRDIRNNGDTYVLGKTKKYKYYPMETKLLHTVLLTHKGDKLYNDCISNDTPFQNIFNTRFKEIRINHGISEVPLIECVRLVNMLTIMKCGVLNMCSRTLLESPSNIRLEELMLAHIGQPTKNLYSSKMEVKDLKYSMITELCHRKDYYVARYLEKNILSQLPSYQTLIKSTELSDIQKDQLIGEILALLVASFNKRIDPWLIDNKRKFNYTEDPRKPTDGGAVNRIFNSTEKLPEISPVFVKQIDNSMLQIGNKHVKNTLNKYINIKISKPQLLKKKLLNLIDSTKFSENFGYIIGPFFVSVAPAIPTIIRGVNAALSENPEEIVSFLTHFVDVPQQDIAPQVKSSGVFNIIHKENSEIPHQILPKQLNLNLNQFEKFHDEVQKRFDSQNQFELKHGIGLSMIIIIFGSGYFIKKYFLG